MASNEFIVDPDLLDLSHPIADLEAIRKLNPQRYEMEQLTGILHEDTEQYACAAYVRTSMDSFWVRGHMPQLPLMPGMLMIEAAAQVASYFTQRHDLLGAQMVGFGGVNNVKFRGVVLPGDVLIVMVRLVKARRNRMIVAHFQGVVDRQLVCEGELKGIPIPVEYIKSQLSRLEAAPQVPPS